MPGVVRVKVLGQPVSVTIKSWLPWLACLSCNKTAATLTWLGPVML